MANGRDDRTKIDFTVADRVMIQSIHDKIDGVIDVKTNVDRNTTWIKVFKWAIGGGGILASLRMFGVI